jgi:hypothetical protein
VALHLRQSILGLGTLETDLEREFEGMRGRTIGIGLLGLVVSADTSQTTESLRFGVSRDFMSTKLGIFELRYMQFTKMLLILYISNCSCKKLTEVETLFRLERGVSTAQQLHTTLRLRQSPLGFEAPETSLERKIKSM